MNVRLPLACAFTSIGALGVIALYAGAQPPALEPQATPPLSRTGTVVVQNADGTVVEQTLDGKTLRTTVPGRTPNAANFVPTTTADGKTVYIYSAQQAADAESLQMAALEQAMAQEARDLTAQHAQADSDAAKAAAKSKLREKLMMIFELQQKRRAHEIARIEERLGKLKDTMKKRDASKDPIIDRRLEQLTGGVDELGWEETGGFSLDPNSPVRYGYPATGLVTQPRFTEPVKPVPGLPGAGAPLLPSPVPVPPPTEPRR